LRRREVLAGATLTAGASLRFAEPAIAQGIRRLTMVIDWKGPGGLPNARRLAERIAHVSHGRIRIEVTPLGAVVRPFQTFDAVQAGVADMFYAPLGYFERRSPTFHFYTSIPFGFTANELFAWVRFGGGQELWDALCAQFNVKPLLSGTTGSQMGGWFMNEITTIEELKGLRYRMGGPGAEVFRRLGAIVLRLPADQIAQSVRSGAIDACEWAGPWLDTAIGLHEMFGFYYHPGWHEPSAALTLGINTRVWDSFEESDRRLIEMVAASEHSASLAEYDVNNARALRKLRTEGTVRIRKFNDAMLMAFAEISKDVVAEVGSGDEHSKRIYASYMDFRSSIRDWSDIAEGAYLGVRAMG
jgi:TRAP-type mannitol/chloroaromatic compound transport system substrate-binding protein